MLFWVLAYLSVGFCLLFILENKDFVLITKKADWRLLENKHRVVTAKAISLFAIITCILVFTIIYPAIYADKLNTFLKKRKPIKKVSLPEKKGLWYENMAGAAGHIYCMECSFIVLIDVLVFDYANDAIIKSYQCLSCGKFTNVSIIKRDVIPDCLCGGILSNTHKLFCPQCNGDKLQYTSYYFI